MTDEEIFEQATKLSGQQRDEFLDDACGDDTNKRQQIDELLQANDRPNSLLDAVPSDDSLASTAEALSKGKHPIIGNYKLLHKLGEGGFGVVYMAEQMEPVRRKVALKIVKTERLGDSTATIARFEAERQALAMMDHPNIAKVFDGGAIPAGTDLLTETLGVADRPFFVMELVNGVPITEYCDKNNLPNRERLDLFVTVCHAVQHAHQKGVIHRDLKPSNILVTLHDGKPVVKVIDFGVAKAINQRLTDKTLYTVLGDMIGTPLYMSPEQAERSGLDIDTRSDIYSLGVLLYELLTGTTPLTTEELREAGILQVQKRILESDPPKPSTRLSNSGNELTVIAKHRSITADKLSRELKGDLDCIVMKALDKDRSRRYDTAKGFANDVERFLNDDAVTARPPSALYMLNKLARRHRGVVATVGMVLGMLVLGLVGIATAWKSEAIQRQIADDSKREEQVATKEAKDAYARAKQLIEENEKHIARQSLMLAFDAFNNGNNLRAEEIVNALKPEEGTAEWIPWRFLRKRLSSQDDDRLQFDSEIECLSLNDQGTFAYLALKDSRLVLLDLESQTKTHVDLEQQAGVSEQRIRYLLVAGDRLVLSRDVDDRHEVVVHVLRTDGTVDAAPISKVEHRDTIRELAVNSVLGLVCSVGWDGKIKLWSIDTAKLVNEWTTDHNQTKVAFSKDGKFLASTGFDGIVSFFNGDGSSAGIKPIELLHRVSDIEIGSSGDGSYQVYLATYFGTEIWEISETKSPQFVRRLRWQRGHNLDLSDDQKSLAVYEVDGASIRVIGTKRSEVLANFSESEYVLGGRGGDWVDLRNEHLYYSRGKQFFIHEIRALTKRRSVTSAAGWYSDFASCNEHSKVAYRHSDYEVGVWDVATQEHLTIAINQRIAASGIAIDGQGRIAVKLKRTMESSADLAIIKPGEASVPELLSLESINIDHLSTIRFSPSKNQIVVSATKGVLLDLNSGNVKELFDVPRNQVLSAEYSPSGRHLLFGGGLFQTGDSEAMLFTLGRANTWGSTPLLSFRNYRAVIDPSEKIAALIEIDGTEIRLWSLDQRKFLDPPLRTNATRLMSLAFSPGGECLVGTSPAGELIFIDYREREIVGTYRMNRPLRHVRFVNRGKHLVISSMDGLITQWEL